MSDVPNITQNFARPSYRPVAPAGGVDPDMRRMAVIAAALGGGMALVIGLVSLSGHTHHGIPVVLAEPGPVRVKPADPGGMKLAGAEDLSTGVETLAPAPEKPALHALRAKVHAAPKVVPPVPVATPAAAVRQTVATPAIAPPAAVQRASVTQPVPRGTLSQGVPFGTTPQGVPFGTTVQLAAFETQQAAEQDWGKLAEKAPGLFDGHVPAVEQASVAGRTVFRLRTGGFANMVAATEFCGRVRAKGGDCTIAAF